MTFINRPLGDFSPGEPVLEDAGRATVEPPRGGFLGSVWMVRSATHPTQIPEP